MPTFHRGAFAVFLCLSLLFVSTTRAADPVRPPAKGSSPLASAVTETRKEGSRFAGVAYLESLPENMRKDLAKNGQVLFGDDKSTDGNFAGYIRAVAIFHQSKKRVFELMTATDKQALYLPHLVSAAVALRPENGQLTDFTVKVMLSSFRFHVMHWFYPEQSRVEWWLDTSQKNDIKAQEGYWQLFDLDDHTTIGEYGTRVETGLAVPHWLQTLFARSDIPAALTAFRQYMDSDGTFRKG